MMFIVATNVVASRPANADWLERRTLVAKEKNKKQRKSFIVATNIIASQPPERRTTGTPTTHANCFITIQLKFSRIHMWSLTMPHMADSVLFVPDCPTLSSSNMC